jgi:hypothetical protein
VDQFETMIDTTTVELEQRMHHLETRLGRLERKWDERDTKEFFQSQFRSLVLFNVFLVFLVPSFVFVILKLS